ncbi:division/cell wall cluster transcriptional repressor MraZ, partial [candidate division KSB1 bacterium]|nr:division/cell wall cluster transcriptional repressor MraZ [candidate division KSB1 bacterium]
GEYEYTIDTKGRLNIPAKFRKAMSPAANDTFVIKEGPEKCLDVYPLDVYQEKIVSKLNNYSEMKRSHRRLTSLIGGSSNYCELDKQGRIMIPPKFLEYASLESKVSIVGAFNRIELWDPQKRAAYIEESKTALDEFDEDTSIES